MQKSLSEIVSKSNSNYLLILVFFLILNVFPSYAQNFNRPVPSILSQYEFLRYDTTSLDSYYFIAPYMQDNSNSVVKSMMILDEDGYLAWWSAGNKKFFDFKYHSDSDVFSYTMRSNGQIKHFIMNNSFDVIDSIQVPIGSGDIHEFQIFPNGNYCFLGLKDTLVDLSSYTIDGNPGSPTTN